MSLKGRTFTGKLENLAKTLRDNFIYATLAKIGSGRVALDVVPKKYAQVSTGNVVEAGSNDNLLVKTAHALKEGYLIRLTATANAIIEDEILVDEVIDANSVRLSAILSAALVAGDTFDIYKPVSERVAADGSSLSTLVAPPIQIMKDGVATDVADHTNPALVVPMPMKLVGVGTTINLTAGDIGVHLSDQGVNFDRTRIGDGTNQWGFNASSEGLVHDADALAQLVLLVAKDFATSAKQDTGNTSLATIAGKDFATETKLEAVRVLLASIAGEDFATETTLATLAGKDFATQTTLAALLTELQLKADLTDTQPVSVQSSALPTGASTEAKQDAEAVLIGAVNETAPASDTASSGLNGRLQRIAQNITSLIGKLPSALGQTTKSGSLSVTVASDQIINVNPTALTNTYDEYLSLTSVQTFVAPANAIGGKIMAKDDNGANIRYKQGGTATTTSGMQLQAGRAEDFTGGSNITVVSESGTNAVMIQWTVHA